MDEGSGFKVSLVASVATAAKLAREIRTKNTTCLAFFPSSTAGAWLRQATEISNALPAFSTLTRSHSRLHADRYSSAVIRVDLAEERTKRSRLRRRVVTPANKCPIIPVALDAARPVCIDQILSHALACATYKRNNAAVSRKRGYAPSNNRCRHIGRN